MNKEQKAAVVEEVAAQIQEADAIFAVDYRGISVDQAAELRVRLGEADAALRVVKNTLTRRAVEKASAEGLEDLLEGPTAFTFVRGDAALAAKALATFRRENGVLEFKGGSMEGDPLSIEEIESISRLPGREALQGQFVGVLASPVTGLVRGLGSLVQGLAVQLRQIEERGLVSGQDAADPGGEESESDAPGDPVAEGEAAEQESEQAETEAPSEGDEEKEG
jgi:large subunit ribosomal protein L10